MTTDNYTIWKNSVLGVGLDVDGAFGKQCIDVLLSWSQACFPGVHWSVLLPPPPSKSAKDLFTSANDRYFIKLLNSGPNFWRTLRPGDMLIFAPSPEDGFSSKYTNLDGHAAVLDHADQTYAYVIQQDGSNPNTKTYYKARSWNYTRCIGALRARTNVVPAPIPSLGDGRIGRTLYIHGIPAKAVVKVGAEPIPRNIFNYLLPGRFHLGPGRQPGLTYKIVGVSKYPDTVTIKTDSFGLVDVNIAKDCEIV